MSQHDRYAIFARSSTSVMSKPQLASPALQNEVLSTRHGWKMSLTGKNSSYFCFTFFFVIYFLVHIIFFLLVYMFLNPFPTQWFLWAGAEKNQKRNIFFWQMYWFNTCLNACVKQISYMSLLSCVFRVYSGLAKHCLSLLAEYGLIESLCARLQLAHIT